MEDILLQFGDAVKALGNGKVAGYLVRFSSDREPDLAGEFFTRDTDFDVEFPGKLSVRYNHGLDETLKLRKLGRGTVKMDEVGVWIEAQLEMRDSYERAIYQLAEAGKLGWSSGSSPHVVDREPAGKAVHIKEWPLIEASLTPCPCEPRNAAVPLKTWQEEASSFKSILTDALEELSDEEEDATKGFPLAAHAAQVVTACAEYTERLEARSEARIKAGRVLSAANRSEIEAVIARLSALLAAAAPESPETGVESAPVEAEDVSPPDPLKNAEPEPAEPAEPEFVPESEVRRLYADFQQAEALLTRVGAGAY